MKEGQSSRTAEAAAALRANHFQNTKNPVFSDPYAFELTSKGWKKLLSNSLIVKVMNSAVLNRTLGLLTGQVVGRSRYAEDLLDQAVQHEHSTICIGGCWPRLICPTRVSPLPCFENF